MRPMIITGKNKQQGSKLQQQIDALRARIAELEGQPPPRRRRK